MTPNQLRMLVPLDGTPEAESVLPALMPLFRTQKVRLTLLGVVPKETVGPSLELYMTRLQTSLLQDEVTAESRIEWGDPATEILRAAKPAHSDLIAMATHGRAGLRRDLVGSVAEAVLRHSEIPVLAFRPGAKIGDWKRIVVGLDGSASAEAVLGESVELARAMGATLHVVHAKHPRTRLTIHPGDAFPVPEEDPQPYIEKIANSLAQKGILALPEVRQGEPAEEILAAARATGAGLICLTTHGRTGLARQLLGSVAESVLRNAPCPVLLRRTVESTARLEKAHERK